MVECCGFAIRTDVEEGLKLLGEEGVMSALRFVFMLSSIRLRDSRRKERREFCEKQNCGVSLDGGGGGRDMMSGRGLGDVVGVEVSFPRAGGRETSSAVREGGDFAGESDVVQNHASLKVKGRVQDIAGRYTT